MSKITTEELLNDPSFREWARGVEGESSTFWNAYLKDNPLERDHLLTVKGMLQGIPFHSRTVTEEEVAEQWAKIAGSPETRSNMLRRRQWGIAAAILLVVGLTGLWFGTRKKVQVYQTGYGEISAPVSLANQQVAVVLNARSKIRYHPTQQEVYLEEGEAWFDVVPGQERPLRVMVGDWTVVVTGTAFSVSRYAEEMAVVLQEGNVVLEHSGVEKRLAPGQVAYLSGEDAIIEKVEISPLLSWVAGRWEFGEGITWSELAQRIEQHFGIEVIFSDPAIQRRQVSGDLLIEDAETLFRALQAYSSLDLEWNEDTLWVQE